MATKVNAVTPTKKARAVQNMKTAVAHAIKHMSADELEILAYTVTIHAWASATGKAKQDLWREHLWPNPLYGSNRQIV